MKKAKAAISLILSIVFCMTLLVPAYAGATPSTQEKAEALSKLSIISGTNGNYNLSGTLKRYEAAVFLVRALGKNEELKAQEKSYNQTGFSDISSTAWYAPYVGYCVKAGYISGVGDNKFKPEDQISEKAFLAVILRALGYKDGTEFSWNNIYQRVYSFGIIKDSAYSAKVTDNTNYTRGDLVNMLYGAMDVKFRGSENTLLDNLIGSGIISKDAAKAAGFNFDKLITAVTSVNSTALNKLSVKFNEDIPMITVNDIIIYDSLDKNKRLTCSIDSLTGTDLVLSTGIQLPDKAYIIEFTNIKDREGNVVAVFGSTFKGFKAGAGNNLFFRIQKVDCVSRNTFNIYFTHPINGNAEIPLYYEILDGNRSLVKGNYQNLSAKCLGGCDNGVAVTLENFELTKDSTYIVRVTGDFYSAYGAEINEGKGDEAVFTGNGAEDSAFGIASLKVTGPNSVEVEFNKYIDPFYGNKFLNYTVTNAAKANMIVNKAAMYTSGDKKGRAVQLTTQLSFERLAQYTLNINFLPDLYKKASINDKTVPFSGTYDIQSELRAIDYQALDAHTIQLTFDRTVDADNAENVNYYSITGGTGVSYYTLPQKVRYEAAGSISKVKLYVPNDKTLENGRLYKVRVSRAVQGAVNTPVTLDKEYSFYGISDTNTKPVISEIAAVSKDTLRVRFNRDIAADTPNVLASNYTLEYMQDGVVIKKVPSIVGYINETTLILKFDKITPGFNYRLSFNSIKDYAGLSARTALDGQNFIDYDYKK